MMKPTARKWSLSLTRGSNDMALTRKLLLFWMRGRLREVVAYRGVQVAHGGSTVMINDKKNILSVGGDLIDYSD